jgi:hypothetical protein
MTRHLSLVLSIAAKVAKNLLPAIRSQAARESDESRHFESQWR